MIEVLSHSGKTSSQSPRRSYRARELKDEYATCAPTLLGMYVAYAHVCTRISQMHV